MSEALDESAREPAWRLVVRRAHSGDTAALRHLYGQLIPEERPDPDAMAALLDTLAGAPDNRLLVGLVDGTVVATCQLVLYDNPVRVPHRKAIVDSVVVDAAWRGLGIGHRLVARACAELETEGCRVIGVSAGYERATGHRLYEGAGFVRYGYHFLRKTEGSGKP